MYVYFYCLAYAKLLNFAHISVTMTPFIKLHIFSNFAFILLLSTHTYIHLFVIVYISIFSFFVFVFTSHYLTFFHLCSFHPLLSAVWPADLRVFHYGFLHSSFNYSFVSAFNLI